jgi:hypothetical protein
MNGQVLIDLAGILEQYAIIYITELFRSFPARQDVVRQLLERQFLDRLAKHLIILWLWDEKDEKEIQKLKKARDAVAHKNVEVVTRGSDRMIYFDRFMNNLLVRIHDRVSFIYCISSIYAALYIVECTNYMLYDIIDTRR